MSSTAAACPFCNAELPPMPAAALPRTPCPRCGEPVPSERFPAQSSAIAAGAPPSAVRTATVAKATRKTLQVVLSIMAGMAAFALVFAIYTQSDRRKLDPRPKGDPADELAQTPSQLLGLGYLPKGTNIVVGLHLAALRKTTAGEALLTPPRPELIAKMLDTLDAVGIAPKDVDHVVLGFELKDFFPQMTTAIVTAKPYDAAQVKEAVQRQSVSEAVHRGKPLYKFTKLPQNPKVWCADPRVLVWTTLKTEDLDRIPGTAPGALEALTPATRKALVDRLNKQSRAWVVGDLEPAKGLVDLAQQFGFLPKEQARVLGLVRSFAIGVTADAQDGLTLIGDFHTGSAAATQELRRYLDEAVVAGATSQKVAAPTADVEDAEAQWVTWQVRAGADAMREALGKVRLLGKRGPP